MICFINFISLPCPAQHAGVIAGAFAAVLQLEAALRQLRFPFPAGPKVQIRGLISINEG